jgi:hypothetical protein
MKKFLLIVAVLLPVLFAPCGTRAQETELPEQLKYIDAQLKIFIPKLTAFQDDYFAVSKAYYQALGSHDKAPATAEVASDLKAKPSDQLMDLTPLWDYSGLPAALNWSFRVDVAVTPWGPGYTLVVQTTVKDTVWTRTVTTVPGEKSQGWMIYDAIEEITIP